MMEGTETKNDVGPRLKIQMRGQKLRVRGSSEFGEAPRSGKLRVRGSSEFLGSSAFGEAPSFWEAPRSGKLRVRGSSEFGEAPRFFGGQEVIPRVSVMNAVSRLISSSWMERNRIPAAARTAGISE